MTLKQALKIFRSEVMPDYRKHTPTSVRCAFNDWIDGLHRDGQITDKQVENWCYLEIKPTRNNAGIRRLIRRVLR